MLSPVNGMSGQDSDPSSAFAVKTVSPRRLYLVTLGVVLISELVIMMYIEVFLDLSPHWEAGLDAVVLTISIIPLLFVTLYRPLHQHLGEVRRTNEELRYSESKYSTVVENSPAGIFIYREGRLVFVNPKLAEILGRPEEELLQTDPADFVVPEHRELLHARIERRMDGGPLEEDEAELQILTPGESGRWISARATTIQYKGTESILGLVQDVTRRKQLEQELRRLSSQRLADQEAERAHLARDLHDGIGQSLSGIKFLIEHTLGQAYPNERREQMEELRALIPKIQDTVDEVRRMSMALRPSTLDDLGLLATITWFLRQLQGACPHIQVEHKLAVEESDVPEGLKIVIYRTLQESLNNAAKHCGECTVKVFLEKHAKRLGLTVEDDGDGFDPEEVEARDATSRGFGLGSMRERVELSGGTFQLQTGPGRGVTVHATWPVV